MDHFHYRQGRMHVEDVAVETIAESVGTPFYAYSTATLTRHFKVFAESVAPLDTTICYAVKANGNLAVLKTLAKLGAGADVVSGGEMKRALAAGIPANKIVFSGVAKSAEEMADALKAGILQINVESEAELDLLCKVAADLGVVAPVAFRINPDVDAKTHAKITTGKSENKFGIDIERVRQLVSGAANHKEIKVAGIAVHIGSQILDLAPFKKAFEKMRDLAEILKADGHPVERIDLGGGLGIPYDNGASPPPAEYGAMVCEVFKDSGWHIVLEPGRVIIGNAGVLITKVQYLKSGATRDFLIVDAGMNDLMRPVLYDADHQIVPVIEPDATAKPKPMDIVGPICETGDTFARQREMAPVLAGELLAIRSAGAYGASMASSYNARALVPEVLVDGDSFAVVRDRVKVEDLMAHETIPPWLKDAG